MKNKKDSQKGQFTPKNSFKNITDDPKTQTFSGQKLFSYLKKEDWWK